MSDALIAHLHDLLDGLGRVTTRRMFGGHGVYLDGTLIGVVIEEALYLKVDAETRLHFEAAGSQPYVYLGQQPPITMSYWSVPEDGHGVAAGDAALGASWPTPRRCARPRASGRS